MEKTALFAGLGQFTDGFDLLVMSGALLTLIPYFHLTKAQVGLITSAPFFGAIIGATLFGWVADKIGRKTTFYFTIGTFILGSTVGALSSNPNTLLLARFITGLGIGGDVPAACSLVAETSQTELRGSSLCIQTLMWGLGGLSALLCAIPFIGFKVAWRILLALGVFPPLITLAVRSRLKESSRWLNAKGSKTSVQHAKAIKLLIFTSSGLFVYTFILAAFATYTPTILREAFNTTLTNSLLVGSLQWLGFSVASAITFILVEKIGRKKLITISTISLIFTLALAALYTTNGSLRGFTASLFALWVAGGVAYTVTTVYAFELFPTRIRGASGGVAFAFGRLGGYTTTLLFPLLLDTGLAHVISFYTLPPIVATIIASTIPPETKRKTLEQLEEELGKTPPT
ncbi:MAG: MFS transporter [Thermoprotei archaeon]